VSPAAFAGFRPEDRALFALPFIDGDRNVPLDWVWGLDLHARCPRLVPYDHVVLERGGDLTARLLELHVSTGAASHPHASSAIYSGLREVIERDAAMIAWYKRVALPRVTLPRVLKNVVADELRAHLIRRGLTFEVFDLRLDVPMPGVFIVATRTRTDGAFEAGATVAASAMGADIETALAHALQELAFHDETLSLFPDPSKDWRRTTYDPRSTSEGRGSWWPLYTHYLNPAHRDAFSFLLSSKKSVALEDIPPLAGQSDAERVTELVALLARVHTQAPIVVDLATPDMLAAARTTVKVLVPGFIDAASGRQTMRLASSRVEGAVRARALPCLAVDLWNPDPHPAM
jgi:ribosomal protein S12 methylthiotransferase accessory factor